MHYKPIHCNTANVYNNTRSNMPANNASSANTSVEPIENTSIDIVEHCIIKKEMADDCSDTDDMSVLITELPRRQPFKFSGIETTKRSSPISSPRGGSAFNWSKFKFNRQSSCDISVSQKRRDTKLPFKKVVSESSLNTYLKKADHLESQTDRKADNSECNIYVEHVTSTESEPVVLEDLENQQNSAPSTGSVHFGSYPYSIDCVADCDFVECESGHQMSQTSSQESDASSHFESILPENNKFRRKSNLSIYFNTNNCKDSDDTVDGSASGIGGREHSESNENSQGVYEQDSCESPDQFSTGAGKQDVIVVKSDDEIEARGQVSQSSVGRKVYNTWR